MRIYVIGSGERMQSKFLEPGKHVIKVTHYYSCQGIANNLSNGSK